MRISDWSSDVCSSDLHPDQRLGAAVLRKSFQRPEVVGAIGGWDDDTLLAPGYQLGIHHNPRCPPVAIGEWMYLADQYHHTGCFLHRLPQRALELHALLQGPVPHPGPNEYSPPPPVALPLQQHPT